MSLILNKIPQAEKPCDPGKEDSREFRGAEEARTFATKIWYSWNMWRLRNSGAPADLRISRGGVNGDYAPLGRESVTLHWPVRTIKKSRPSLIFAWSCQIWKFRGAPSGHFQILFSLREDLWIGDDSRISYRLCLGIHVQCDKVILLHDFHVVFLICFGMIVNILDPSR